jgi:hypothetical protein
MRIALDEVVHFDVLTHSPTTGAITDADATPTFEVFEEATDTDIGVGGNLTKRTSKTGDYRGTFTASAANGFEAGKFYVVVASATVGGTAGKAIALHFQMGVAETTAGVPKTDVYDAAAVGTALLDLANGVETGYTLRQALRVMAAVLCGKVSGGPGAPVFRDMTDAANRVASTSDANGNRTAVTLTP